MRDATRFVTSAAVGGLVLLCTAELCAQRAPQIQPVTHIASISTGSIHGTVQDEKGAPVAGAMVSAVGATNAFGVSDRLGRFELSTLSPGPYVLRAHLPGFVASRGQVVDVRPSARVSSAIALRHAAGTAPVLAAGVGAAAGSAPEEPSDVTPSKAGGDDHGELAWRLRHVRRAILKDADVPSVILVEETPESSGLDAPASSGRTLSSPARLASSLFAGTEFSGQLNLLTTGSFDTPQQLFTSNNFSRSIANVALGAPVGEHADWTARAALTQGDIAAWYVAGEYTTRAPAAHRYDIGVSYSTQRYDGGNFEALRSVTDGSRNAGALYGYDTFTISPRMTVAYGSRYARYDYLGDPSLFSPAVAFTLTPIDRFRVRAALSRRALAPGAEEFTPSTDGGLWLPPQRTFSSLLVGRPLEAERTMHAEVAIERDLANTTLTIRAFRQRVDEQMVTLFGLDTPGMGASVGHYFIATAGDVDAAGVSAGLRTALANRVHGSVEYSLTRAVFGPADAAPYMLLFAPSAMRVDAERVHDLSTSIETDVPETSTRVVVLYRVSNGFAHPGGVAKSRAATDRSGLDSRFDVEVRQSLPFMDFSSTKWEMLVGIRNFFHETAADQSVYDELLVVRPPKRIVGGLALKF